MQRENRRNICNMAWFFLKTLHPNYGLKNMKEERHEKDNCQ